ncbi:MAG TPA: hypothetical protein VK696_09925 [Steroidobacteraceae bacterium]|nr:hypothetical protein [Steroidobacteraceae bacterium]
MKSKVLVAAILATACAYVGASAADLPGPDAIDQQTLERALFLCQWKSSHAVPDSAPTPAVCKSGAVSVDDAMLQDKQWWTFWARLNPDEALKANQAFSADFVAFRARLKLKPERAQDLLPPGIQLLKDDWRLKLVQKLRANP